MRRVEVAGPEELLEYHESQPGDLSTTEKPKSGHYARVLVGVEPTITHYIPAHVDVELKRAQIRALIRNGFEVQDREEN